ncbi:hypothetical protein [Absidia glauca]|uniref:RRM domain-containing protein n=1 Tax=Absidia glauca TaxID=4829 RepID=A0A168MTX3_ABSGL|nr:hypothetical protein [Absidia glauca]
MMSETSFLPYPSYANDLRGTHPLSSSPAPSSLFNHPHNNVHPSSSSLLQDNSGGLLGLEQVTTIFVVGFPEDMQEREFQNMFMFSPGFEASSLQWYSKDQDDDSATINTSSTSTSSSTTNMPLNGGKKQMIGFAKFRSRLEALEAVEVISGKKVDQDKGLVLKAEMAKKNLHVKRKSIIPTDGSMATSTPLESVFINNNNNSNNNNKSLISGYHDEPFNFSPLPSDLLSPMVDYKSDPFTLAAVHQQHQQHSYNGNSNSMMAPSSTPVFNDNLFGFRSYSIDGRNNGFAPPRPSISSNTSFTKRMSIKQQQQQHQQQQQQQQQQQLFHTNSTRSITEDMDPFNYMSKSSPVPADHVGSYFSDDISFGSLSINDNFGLRSNDHSTLTSPTSPQRSNSLMSRPSLMTVNESAPTAATTNNNGINSSSNNLNLSNNSGNGFMNNMMTMMMMTASSTPRTVTPPTTTTTSSSSTTTTTATTNLADQNPPCNTLYVGNLPPANTVEDELRQLFSKCAGYKRMYFRTKSQGPMCFVEFDDIMYATQCMADLQGHCLSNSFKGGIRLSFSKNPLFIKPQHKAAADQDTPRNGDFAFDPQF